MQLLNEIRNSNKKPKELVVYLTEEIKKDKNLFVQLIEGLTGGSDVERGTCADLLKHVTKDKPEYALPYLDTIIELITFKLPRVKWGTAEAIANIAQKFPQKAGLAIPNLLVNTKDPSTVVRWCAAYGLTEIAKNDKKLAEKLIPKFKEIVGKEKNNGVKNVYLKTLKVITNS
jgi:hypothetical protein